MFQRFDGGIQSCHFRCLFYRLISDRIIIEGDLVFHRPRNHVEGLLHIAEQLSLLRFWNITSRDSLDQHLAVLWLVKSQQQLKYGALSCSGTTGQCNLFAFLYLDIDVV